MKDWLADRMSPTASCLAIVLIGVLLLAVVFLLSGCLLVQQDRLRNTVDGMRPLIFHTQGLD